jgi:hypothetical protein
MTKSPHKVVEADDVIVDAPTLAHVCRLDVRTVLKLGEQGVVVRVARGRFAQWESIGNLMAHYRAQAAGRIGRDENVDAVRANCELKNSQRRLNEIRIARMDGALISLPEVEAAWAEIVEIFTCEIRGTRRTLTPPVLVRIQVPQPPSRGFLASLATLAKASARSPEPATEWDRLACAHIQ